MKRKLKETLHIGGDVFFAGEVFVTEAQNEAIDAELKRREEEGEIPPESTFNLLSYDEAMARASKGDLSEDVIKSLEAARGTVQPKNDLPNKSALSAMKKDDLLAQAKLEGLEVTAEMDTNPKIVDAILANRK